jgi:uncharacterized membrane protein YphA (DoxX/SURF4 family)
MGFLDKGKEYAPSIARYGVGVVFFIFGISQLLSPENWLGYLPSFTYNLGITPGNLIFMNGIFDLVLGLFLLLGLFVRIFALLGSLHLIGIIVSLGYSDVAVRDLGLLIVLISIFLNEQDRLCLGKHRNV